MRFSALKSGWHFQIVYFYNLNQKANQLFMENTRPQQETWNQPNQDYRPQYSQDNKRVLTGVLAIILGSLGVHKFVLGYNNEGFVLLILTVIGYATLCIFIGAFVLTATSLIGLIEGIVYLTKSDEEFYELYQKNKRPWF